jgi:hypothetical protein
MIFIFIFFSSFFICHVSHMKLYGFQVLLAVEEEKNTCLIKKLKAILRIQNI